MDKNSKKEKKNEDFCPLLLKEENRLWEGSIRCPILWEFWKVIMEEHLYIQSTQN